MLHLILLVAPHPRDPAVWIKLLQDLEGVRPLVLERWDIHSCLLRNWSRVFPPISSELINPCLTVLWSEFGPFFSLHLPDEWEDVALTAHLESPSPAPIPPVIVHQL